MTSLLLAEIVLLAAGAVGLPAPPTFSAEVRVVRLPVAVSRGGKLVKGLGAGDFEVRDDGVLQQVELLRADELRVNAVFVLDVSASVRGAELEQLKAAACAFLGGLAEWDSAAVLTFADEVQQLGRPGRGADKCAALEEVEAGGATALFDAAYLGLMAADPGRARPIVVLFSDGYDATSWLGAQDVIELARDSEAVVYCVTSRAGSLPKGHPAREMEGAALALYDDRLKVRSNTKCGGEFLCALAGETGGRLWQSVTVGRYKQAFLDVLEDLRNRYVLRYEPQGVKGAGWHSIRVRLKRGKGEVRARQGYRITGAESGKGLSGGSWVR